MTVRQAKLPALKVKEVRRVEIRRLEKGESKRIDSVAAAAGVAFGRFSSPFFLSFVLRLLLVVSRI